MSLRPENFDEKWKAFIPGLFINNLFPSNVGTCGMFAPEIKWST